MVSASLNDTIVSSSECQIWIFFWETEFMYSILSGIKKLPAHIHQATKWSSVNGIFHSDIIERRKQAPRECPTNTVSWIDGREVRIFWNTIFHSSYWALSDDGIFGKKTNHPAIEYDWARWFFHHFFSFHGSIRYFKSPSLYSWDDSYESPQPMITNDFIKYV